MRDFQDFIARENIRRYKQKLSESVDEREQETLRQLLSDEEARFQQVQSCSRGTKSL